MANYQNYAGNNVEQNQFNTDINNNNALMLTNFMQTLDQASKSQQPHTNTPNNFVYALPNGGFTFPQQIQNGFTPQYLNGFNGMQFLQMTNGNPQLGVYINNQSQPNVDVYNNGMQPLINFQNIPHGMMQVDLNELNKNNQQRAMKTQKRSYSEHTKPQEPGEIEYDHKNRPLIYNCKECPRKFSMNSRLATHMRCHNGERPHVCHQCNFAFTQKSYLVRHAAVHKEERPYQCVACKKTYKHYGSLANHRKTHKNNNNGFKEENEDNNNNVYVDNVINNCDNGKREPECIVDESAAFQAQQFLFAPHETKLEPQSQAFMATDLSTEHHINSDQHSFLQQLNNQYAQQQSGVFYTTNTDQSDIPVSNDTLSTFTV